MKKTALIMAGGRGERFWPKSRKNLPKQFLSLSENGKTMIQLTVERILPLVDINDVYIATNKDYKSLVIQQLPDLPEENILCEPAGRNTAPCIGLGAVTISKKYEDAVMLVLPSDHMIKYNTIFEEVLESASKFAQNGKNIVTLGITPTYPETGYGYIKFNPGKKIDKAYAVDHFAEKPDFATAEKYLETDRYLWNSGMFVWKVSTILDNIREFLPDIYTGLCAIKEAIGTENYISVLEKEFNAFVPQSIDYGVMEKASDIYTIPCAFGWDDVGSWLAIEKIRATDEKGNIIDGNVIAVDTCDCTIQGDKKLISVVGVDNLIVIDTEDAILICNKNSTQSVRNIIQRLKDDNKQEYL